MKSFPRDILEFTEWMTELKLQNPDFYRHIENYFKFKEAGRKLGVLLDASIDRRQPVGMARPSMASDGSNRDSGAKQP